MLDKVMNAIISDGLGITSKEDFMRSASLMRNPENGRCPACKLQIRTNDKGDQYCQKFDLDYKKNGGCYWHRYKDGLNYWSSIKEIASIHGLFNT